MLIQCTNKLLKQLQIKPNPRPKEKPLFSWHANLITIDRRKAVVLVNDQNRFVIVLYGLRANDFKNINYLIEKAIRLIFQQEQISDEIITEYIQHSPEITFTKTKDRSSIAKMNQSISTVRSYSDILDHENIIQIAVSKKVSRFLVGDGNDDYIYPNHELYSDFETFSGKPAIQTEGVQVKITLQMEHFQIWRRLTIPLQLTFRELHQVIQTAFGWQDYHLHEFYIYEELTREDEDDTIQNPYDLTHKPGMAPIVNIISNEEAFDFEEDIPMILDTEVLLSDYLPNYKTMRYNYDFGDGWQHEIKVEKFNPSYDKKDPVCLEGEGNTPPEDVGGEYGYMEFRKIIADENHPEHEQMVAWGNSQMYRDFNIKIVNLYLENKF